MKERKRVPFYLNTVYYVVLGILIQEDWLLG